ncbi:carbon-nitrogen hydrolase family protein [Sphingorhabdus pulchriflava]|uniref:Carbon-nitrogen hydrolase family protein n=1 Tax=Sphingorhabdus pulchriflava TaxID=2292257 RepID=A0A371BIV2_9SPHN|nr:carbon-nitrogen hydrolase family protein [Sphingorhabdus pulchriflava]RDV07522.1 carbon-nitrogen hydrolase family protein [Sphingorhabdus pulchriflava]
MRIAVHQMNSAFDIQQNVMVMIAGIREAKAGGAAAYFAPEMSLLLDRDRVRAKTLITTEANTTALLAIAEAASQAGIWVHIGSFPVVSERAADRFFNRTIVFDSSGHIQSRYDKMHLFDVDLATGESWRESAAYLGGDRPVMTASPLGPMGLTICYDLRFSELFSTLARSGAVAFAVPAAFTVPTGAAHWHVLLRARAIESAAFVIAAAQSGKHADGRETYGHSLVVDPWGEVLLDMGEGEGLGFVDLDLDRVQAVRAQIPVHLNRRDIPPLL